MSDQSQLDRMEKKLDYLYDHVVKQTERNGKYDAHLNNHSKANKAVVWLVGICVSLGLIKGMGG